VETERRRAANITVPRVTASHLWLERKQLRSWSPSYCKFRIRLRRNRATAVGALYRY